MQCPCEDAADDVGSSRCWQDSESQQSFCEVLFEEESRPLLTALREAHTEHIKLSHCALSFGGDVPLRSETCFTSTRVDAAGGHAGFHDRNTQ
jgi:hypothetical protein